MRFLRHINSRKNVRAVVLVCIMFTALNFWIRHNPSLNILNSNSPDSKFHHNSEEDDFIVNEKQTKRKSRVFNQLHSDNDKLSKENNGEQLSLPKKNYFHVNGQVLANDKWLDKLQPDLSSAESDIKDLLPYQQIDDNKVIVDNLQPLHNVTHDEQLLNNNVINMPSGGLPLPKEIYIVLKETPKPMLDLQKSIRPTPSTSSGLRYTPPRQSNVTTVGVPFNVDQQVLDSLHIPIKKNFIEQTEENLSNFVFATAATRDYIFEDLEAIATVQKYFPNHTIIFYDFEGNAFPPKVVRKVKNLCNVVYRKFNFSRYPDHAVALRGYYWKPLLIHDLLLEYPGVFWIDSSIRFISGDLGVVKREVVRNNGILTFMTTGHSNFAVTHSTMYDYLPTSLEAMKRTEQREAGCLLVFRTREVYQNIILWWTMCALNPQCMASSHMSGCGIKSWSVYANCHRFDQSAINILISNYFGFDDKRYYASVRIGEVHRYSVGLEMSKVCFLGPHEPTRMSVNSKLYMLPALIASNLTVVHYLGGATDMPPTIMPKRSLVKKSNMFNFTPFLYIGNTT